MTSRFIKPVTKRRSPHLYRFALLGAAAWILNSAGLPARGQDLDVVLYAGDPAKPAMIDKIEDAEEREAFLALKAVQDPGRKRELAEEFLQKYPESWLTSFAHAMAAKACVALDDLQAGLAHGQRSLEILPENGSLLVTLANVQVHGGLLDEAEVSATDALEHLRRFQHASIYSKAEWASIRQELQGSAHYVLGRVAATRGLRSNGQRRAEQLSVAQRSLRSALALNRSDGIAALLLGIVEYELGNRDAALASLAEAAQSPGPAQSRALAKLQEIHQSDSPPTESFGEFRASIRALRIDPRWNQEMPGAIGDESGTYAGSESCAACHQEVTEAWSGTGMAKMFRTYAPENVIGDFSENNEFRDASGELLARMLIEDGRHYFELPAGAGRQRFRVDYTIGSKWQQAYATRLPSGRIHVVPIQYNRLHGKWVNFWEILDDGSSERSKVRNFHQMKASTSYQVHCSACHTSQVQAEGAVIAPERMTFREAGVNCEMCHGPSQAHIDAMQQGREVSAAANEPPLRFQDLDHRTYVAACAQCHMQSGVLQPGARGELNYSGRQVAFMTQRLQRPYEEYSRNAFYKDGRFRETTFIVEAFMRSQCFRQGQAHCGHCHDPHPADSQTNPTSLKFRADQDQMCLQCHETLAANVESHTRHAASSEASRCAACHMPAIMNSMMFMAGTHRIDDIPNAAMTEKFGRSDSPNACLACHAEESNAWLASELANW